MPYKERDSSIVASYIAGTETKDWLINTIKSERYRRY
jgi:hypothetical protein